MPQGKANTPERFWQRVDMGGACWRWMGARLPAGYGRLSFQRRSMYAHRVAYLLTYGVIPEGLCVLHRCDNPPCVRPDHLFLGTQTDNARDRERKNRGGWRNHQRKPRPAPLGIRRVLGPTEQWSPLRPHCGACGETQRRFMAKGLCSRCYLREWKRQRKEVAS